MNGLDTATESARVTRSEFLIAIMVLVVFSFTACNQKTTGVSSTNIQHATSVSPASGKKIEGLVGKESQDEVAAHMVSLGFQSQGCHQPSTQIAMPADYVPATYCVFTRDDDEQVNAVFNKGRLQSFNYNFGIRRFQRILSDLNRTYGSPKSGHYLPNCYEWVNSTANISLAQNPDGKGGSTGFIVFGVASEPFPAPIFETPEERAEAHADKLSPLGPVESIFSKTADERFMILGITTGQSLEEVNAALRSGAFAPLNASPDFVGQGHCYQGTTSNPQVATLTCDTVRANEDSAGSKLVEDDSYARLDSMQFIAKGAGHWSLVSYKFTCKSIDDKAHWLSTIMALKRVFGSPALSRDGAARWGSTQQVCVNAGCDAATFAFYDGSEIWVQDSALIQKLVD